MSKARSLLGVLLTGVLIAGVVAGPALGADPPRKKLHADAEDITGSTLTLSGEPSVKATEVATNEPVAGLLFTFESASTGTVACSAFTNTEGVASCSSGSNFSPVFIFDAFVSGYKAVFDGNTEYRPVEAHGTVTPGV